MSWSVTYASVENFKADIREPYSNGTDTEEAKEQLGMGRLCAQQLMDSGCVGEPDDMDDLGNVKPLNYRIGIYGHANPGHKPAEGWANDCVTVSVTQL